MTGSTPGHGSNPARGDLKRKGATIQCAEVFALPLSVPAGVLALKGILLRIGLLLSLGPYGTRGQIALRGLSDGQKAGPTSIISVFASIYLVKLVECFFPVLNQKIRLPDFIPPEYENTRSVEFGSPVWAAFREPVATERSGDGRKSHFEKDGPLFADPRYDRDVFCPHH
jgi:hypothetical protein